MQVLTNQLRKNKIRNMLRKQRQISFMSITIGGKLQIALPQQSNTLISIVIAIKSTMYIFGFLVGKKDPNSTYFTTDCIVVP